MKKFKAVDLKLIGIVLGFIATLMILFPALNTSDSNGSYLGSQVVFGHEFISLGGFGSGEIQFSFLNLIAYLLPAIAAVLLLFSKINQLVSTIIFLVAAIMLFLVTEFTVVTVTILSNVTEVSVDWHYSIGLIIAIVLSLFGFLLGLFRITQKD